MVNTHCYCSTSDGSHAMDCPFRPTATIFPVGTIHYLWPPIPQMGWICPKCSAGVAPHMSICPCAERDIKVAVTWQQSNRLANFQATCG